MIYVLIEDIKFSVSGETVRAGTQGTVVRASNIGQENKFWFFPVNSAPSHVKQFAETVGLLVETGQISANDNLCVIKKRNGVEVVSAEFRGPKEGFHPKMVEIEPSVILAKQFGDAYRDEIGLLADVLFGGSVHWFSLSGYITEHHLGQEKIEQQLGGRFLSPEEAETINEIYMDMVEAANETLADILADMLNAEIGDEVVL